MLRRDSCALSHLGNGARIYALFVVLIGVTNQIVLADDVEFTFVSLPQHVDLGDITSSGEMGRQLYVEPTDPSRPFAYYRFFPPHDVLPDAYPEPTPPSPRQDSIQLFENTPLSVVIPQLAHFPFRAAIDVSHSITDHQIALHASIHYYGSVTATIYGPHEYLWPLGALDPGEYRLTLNFSQTSEQGETFPSSTSGFIRFTVLPVPEPSSLFFVVAAAAYFALGNSRERLSRVSFRR